MKEKLIRDFRVLPKTQLKQIADSLVNGQYDIEIAKPSRKNKPVGIYKILTKRRAFQKIFNNKNATYRYLILSFNLKEDKICIKIPASVFGINQEEGIKFPIIIGQFCGLHIMTGKEQLGKILGLDLDSVEQHFERLLQIRFQLIKKLFSFYRNGPNTDLVSVMSWGRKPKESATRIIAESIGFIYHAPEEMKSDYFLSEELEDSGYAYLESCGNRWGQLDVSDSWITMSQNYLIRLFPFYRAKEFKKYEHMQSYFNHLLVAN